MNHLNCPEDVDSDYLRRELHLASFINYRLIDDFIMENVNEVNDQYNVVTLAIYYAIKFNFPITQIVTLLRTCCSDVGTCVNGFTLLQTMVLCNKSKQEIQTAVEAGMFRSGYSEITNNKVITIACKQMMKMQNDSFKNLEHFLDVIEYLICIESDEPSIQDLSYLAYICFANKDIIVKHKLWETIKNLIKKNPMFEHLMKKLEMYGEKRITAENKYTILSLLKVSAEKLSMILQNKEFEDFLDSKLQHLEIFGCLVLSHFTEAKRLANKIREAVANLEEYSGLDYYSVLEVIKYLSGKNLDDFNEALKKGFHE